MACVLSDFQIPYGLASSLLEIDNKSETRMTTSGLQQDQDTQKVKKSIYVI